MARFLARRAATAFVVLLGVSFITFMLARVVPADPAASYVGQRARPAQIEQARQQLGLDRPVLEQYWTYLKDISTGDWGTSIGTKRPVLDEIGSRFPATLELLLVAIAIAAVLGVVLGVLAARHRGRALDTALRLFSTAGISMPAFWLGLLFQIVFANQLGLLPPTGRYASDLQFTSPLTQVTGLVLVDSVVTGNVAVFRSAVEHMLLPALTLAAYPTGVIARMVRASMLEALGQDYVRAARAYGVPERVVLWRIALRNALPPATTVLGLTLAYLLTGAFFVEVVFNWPGLGQFTADALLSSDYPAIMGVTLLGAVGYIVVNLAVDLVQARLDPRVRLS